MDSETEILENKSDVTRIKDFPTVSASNSVAQGLYYYLINSVKKNHSEFEFLLHNYINGCVNLGCFGFGVMRK